MHRRAMLRALVGAAGGIALTGESVMLDDQPTRTLAALRAATKRIEQTTYGTARLTAIRRHVGAIVTATHQVLRDEDVREAQIAIAEASLVHTSSARDLLDHHEAAGAAGTMLAEAQAAGDRDLTALGWIEVAAVHQTLYRDHKGAIKAARAAVKTSATAGMRATALCRLGSAQAATGERYDALSTLAAAEVAADKGQANPWRATDPPGVALFCADVHSKLGKGRAAVSMLEPVMGAWPQGSGMRLWAQIGMVGALTAAREPDAAATLALEVLEAAAHQVSGLKLDRLLDVAGPLMANWPDRPRVVELRERIPSVV